MKIARTYLLVIGIIVFVGIIAFYQYSSLENKEPKIEITPNFYDFGDIPYELVEHTFSVKNIGGGVLEVTRISTSCGCTKGVIDKELIGSGEVANLLVTFDPNLMEEEIKGKIERVVYIKSNDLDNPEVEIDLIANIR